mmetsp:Transcript_29487/g.70187  ORF Transcript_29487/g.70187 Transcript_29487/m.70187 type:complete len:137 (-) Transcript_29487:91-501(-)|eukprot:CAMPEP_0180144190 /NCGR_PEP_ID=MMETSP0986-20121125/16736_1 /TAXON_ID=697907 /ORGANISM="non described non described, Strain CCMP2293" /LENGTH=136 /DNA_ID=CAMNT_0022087947 /DNA_START=160 /DNA_END=570 /DNA_ORIENTATION=+
MSTPAGWFAKGGTLNTWFHRFKWMAVASIAGDIAFIGGASYSMHAYPSARLFIGELSPQLQDAYYMLVDRYVGKDQVLEKRDKDVEEAAKQYTQARNASQLTRELWYGEAPPAPEPRRRQQGGLAGLVGNLSGRSS